MRSASSHLEVSNLMRSPGFTLLAACALAALVSGASGCANCEGDSHSSSPPPSGSAGASTVRHMPFQVPRRFPLPTAPGSGSSDPAAAPPPAPHD